jgi:hypothetical protein
MTEHMRGEVPAPAETESPEETLGGRTFIALGREDLLDREIRLPDGSIVPAHMFHLAYGNPAGIEKSELRIRGWLRFRTANPTDHRVAIGDDAMRARIALVEEMLIPVPEAAE